MTKEVYAYMSKTRGHSSNGIAYPAVPEKPEVIHPVVVPNYMQHPIAASRYTILTDAMFQLHEHLLDAISLGISGTIIYGSAYAGKSSAISEVAKWLKEKQPQKFLTYLITLNDKKDFKYKEFYQFLSDNLGCSLPVKTTDTNRVTNNLIASLVMRARKHNNKIVLILDECEGLQIAQYKQLKYLYNKLREADVVLITFLVGTDAMLSTKEIFEKSGSEGEQITRRFMQGLYEFHSVSDLDQLKYVLDSYDTMKFGGLTYTQYYFPEAWKKGVRLSDIAEEMLDVMLEISGLTVLPEVPMGYLTTLINAIYLTYGADTEKVDGNGKSLKREWPSRSEIRDMMYKQNIEKKLIDLAAKNVVTREGRMYA